MGKEHITFQTFRKRFVERIRKSISLSLNEQIDDQDSDFDFEAHSKKIKEEQSLKILEEKNKRTEEDELQDIIFKKKNEKQLMKLVHYEHHISYQNTTDLFTLLYTSLVFKWINSDKIIILVEGPKLGYKLEIFLRNFKINSVYLDQCNPLSTNLHFFNAFLKGHYKVLILDPISFNKNKNKSKKKKKIDYSIFSAISQVINSTVIFFDYIDPYSIEEVSCDSRVKEIFHFINVPNQEVLKENYSLISDDISFEPFKYNDEQLKHLRYRCEDIYHQITKNDIKKTKFKKINQELLHSRKLKTYFEQNKEEKEKVIENINKNSIKKYKPGVEYLPSYLVHQEKTSDIKNLIESEKIN